MEIANQPNSYDDLIQMLQTFCREEMGMRPRRIRVNLDHDAIILLLEQTLSPAEEQAIQTAAGVQLLETYQERLLDMVKPRLQLLIEETIKRPVISAYLHADVRAGNVVGVFGLSENPVHPEP